MPAPVIIRCSCSISSAIWKAAPCAHSADRWDGVLKPVVARYQVKVSRIYLRADAGFANPDVYEFLGAGGSNTPFAGELYPRVGFIVTNMSSPSENVVAFYNKRGTCEQWIKEGKGAIRWTRLSCRSFVANAVRLQLHALAYNLGNFLRALGTPEPIKDWSLTSLKDKLIKIGAKVVSHGRYVAFQMAEVAIPKNLFADILRMIAELRPPPVASTA
jgi:hypothetical protein